MSALCAVFRRDRAAVDPGCARAILDAQRARGPDAANVWAEGAIAIGHGLFATTAEDRLGAQPWKTSEGRVVVALDGRIDNREEIAAWTGARLTEVPDVAFVAAAYEAWGAAFAERLLGDFAAIVWDARVGELIAARDVVGGRPLYFREEGREVRCASHAGALFAGTGERALRASFDAMAMFLVERYVERTQTLLEGVCAVAPGETRRFGGASTRSMVTAWPVPPSGRVQRSLRDHEEELLGTLREAVRVRMRAEGAVCAHVSGGLDSSAVAALATGLARETGGSEPMLVRCVFPGMECDESSHSQAVADHLRLPIASAEMPGELSEYTLNSTRAPRAYFANPVSRMLVRGIETARGLGARVTLTGAGSDQLMQATGYEAADAILRRDARAVLAWSSFWEAPLSRATYRRIARQGFGRAVPEQVRRSARALAGQGDGLPAWMTGSARSAVRRLSVPALGGGRFDGFARLPARRLATQLWWDPDYTFSIVAADAIGAAHGGELRHPFFDRRVIEMMLRLPAEVRSAGPPAKLFLRRAIGARLPASVAGRTSAAEFSPFVKAALIDAHGEELSEMMRESHLADAGLVEPGAVATLVERARRGEQEVLREVVTIAALEVWLRQAASGLLIHGLAPRGPSP